LERLKELIVTFFYTGYSPFASGTAGSAGALVLALLVPTSVHFGAACVAIVLIALVLGVPLGKWAEKRYGKKDPGPFVLDEVAGYFVALFRINAGAPGWSELLVAFFVFRLFDVVKPPPGRRFESIPGGWGIMLDDIVAGLYTLMAVVVFRQFYLDLPF